ncbi:MAG: sulfatase [Planctomycetota bacterium]
MKIARTIWASLSAGLVIGWLWGFIEGLSHILCYLIREYARSGAWPLFSVLDMMGIPFLAAGLNALVLAVISLLLSPPAYALLRRLPERFAPDNIQKTSALICLSGVFFFNLYWHTRPILFYGLKFYDPRRIAAAALFAVAAIVTAWLCLKAVNPLISRAKKKPAAFMAGVLIAFSGSALFLAREQTLERPMQETARNRPNIVLVVPDALRADHLGCYGYDPYDRPVSPFLDRLAKQEGVLFEHAVTQAPYTWTSFGSFLTGKYPRRHGLLRMDPTQRLDPKDNVTLAEILHDAGYMCGAFLMGTLSNNSGLLQGFDTYFEAIVGHDPISIHSKWSIFKSDLVLMRLYNKIKQARDPALVNTLAQRFVREMKDRPFFLMVHYYATHTPYDPPEPYKSMYDPEYEGAFKVFTQGHNFAVMDGRISMSDRDLRHIKALYDGGVTFVDTMISDLHDTLEATGVLDNTLLIIISDHGEELYDHAVFEHDWMYNTNQLVPLIMRMPGKAFGGKRISTPVSLIDLLPTIMEVSGIRLPENLAGEIDGRSLLDVMRAELPAKSEPVYSFCENNRYLSVQDKSFKLIRYRWNDRAEDDRLYDLASDPAETRNVMSLHPDEYARLCAVLDAFDASMPTESKSYETDPELQKRLFELGYIQGNNPRLEGELQNRKEK